MTNAFTAKPKLDPKFLKDIKASNDRKRAGQARSRQPGAAKTYSEKAVSTRTQEK